MAFEPLCAAIEPTIARRRIVHVTSEVFDFDVTRWAVDPWGLLELRPVGEELPDGWRWRDDEPERPEAA